MRKRGVRFKLQEDRRIQLQEILRPIHIESYIWHLYNVEIYESINEKDNNVVGIWEFEQPFIESGEELRQRFEHSTHYAVFGEFIGFPHGKEVYEVNTYEEFVESKAEIVFLIVDSAFFDIYCKDLNLIESIYSHCLSSGFESVEYIDDEDDPRYKLSVW
jgi:hypothetical protein